MRSNPPPVVWITGLSGAGKTTLACRLVEILRERGRTVIHLDGDRMREVLGNDLGHDPRDRLENAYRISRLCRFLQGEGVMVVCSTMSLYPEIWSENRKSLSPYVEVYLRVPVSVLHERDPKGLYTRVARGEASNVVGFDLQFHEPAAAHLVLDNASPQDLLPNTATILRALEPWQST